MLKKGKGIILLLIAFTVVPFLTSCRDTKTVIKPVQDKSIIFAVNIPHSKSKSSFLSALTLLDKKIYVATIDGYLSCFTTDGKLQWSIKTDASFTTISSYANKLYASSYDNHIYCINKDGKILWTTNVDGFTFRSLEFYDGALLIAPSKLTAYCVDANSGLILWKTKIMNSNTVSYMYDAAIGDNGKVYFGTIFKTFYCLNAENGNILWDFKAEDKIATKPVIYKDNIIFVDLSGNLYCLNKENGSLVWNVCVGTDKDSKEWFTNVYRDQNNLYIVSSEELVDFDLRNRKILWKISHPDSHSPHHNLFVGKKYLYEYLYGSGLAFINKSNGEVEKEIAIKSDDSQCNLLLYDGKIFTSSSDGYLYCINGD